MTEPCRVKGCKEVADESSPFYVDFHQDGLDPLQSVEVFFCEGHQEDLPDPLVEVVRSEQGTTITNPDLSDIVGPNAALTERAKDVLQEAYVQIRPENPRVNPKVLERVVETCRGRGERVGVLEALEIFVAEVKEKDT